MNWMRSKVAETIFPILTIESEGRCLRSPTCIIISYWADIFLNNSSLRVSQTVHIRHVHQAYARAQMLRHSPYAIEDLSFH
jgi:hypothetical protein